jgi:hypothetical protein
MLLPAALSGSNFKAPGFAGGYLLRSRNQSKRRITGCGAKDEFDGFQGSPQPHTSRQDYRLRQCHTESGSIASRSPPSSCPSPRGEKERSNYPQREFWGPLSPRGERQSEGGLGEAINRIWYHSRESGNPCSPKTQFAHTFSMGPRLRGDDGCDAMLAPMRLRGDGAEAVINSGRWYRLPFRPGAWLPHAPRTRPSFRFHSRRRIVRFWPLLRLALPMRSPPLPPLLASS